LPPLAHTFDLPTHRPKPCRWTPCSADVKTPSCSTSPCPNILDLLPSWSPACVSVLVYSFSMTVPFFFYLGPLTFQYDTPPVRHRQRPTATSWRPRRPMFSPHHRPFSHPFPTVLIRLVSLAYKPSKRARVGQATIRNITLCLLFSLTRDFKDSCLPLTSFSPTARPPTLNALPRRRADSRSKSSSSLISKSRLLGLSHLSQQHRSLDLCLSLSNFDFSTLLSLPSLETTLPISQLHYLSSMALSCK